jgi:hypothetical protein
MVEWERFYVRVDRRAQIPATYATENVLTWRLLLHIFRQIA